MTEGLHSPFHALPLPCGHDARTGVQYQGTAEDYDGISEWICDVCGKRWGRWTKRELEFDDIERRYGRNQC